MFDPEELELIGDEPVDVTLVGLGGDPDELALAQRALEPVRAELASAGFYAYATFDDEGRWSVAVDDEQGRVDVRIGSDGYVVEISNSSPGLFSEVEEDWRRRAHERLARMIIPNIARGLLLPHQRATWDSTEQGVSVELHYELPFTATPQIAQFVVERFPEVNDVIAKVESQIVT